MSDTAIRVENLGKRYTLGTAKSGSFRESMSSLFRRRENGEGKTEKGERETGVRSPSSVLPSPSDFWALNDINFEIKRGEADDGVPRRHYWPPIRMMTDGLQ